MAGLGSLVVSLALQNGPYIQGLEQSDKRANQFARNQNRAFNSVKSSAISAAKGLVGAFGALQAAKSFIRITDQYTQLTGQLKLATRSQEEFNQAYQNSIRIAQTAQAPLEQTAKLYARVSNATRQMGANQASVAAITESTALALKVSGATAEESASAMLQLSQAFGSGVLRGEEFNAVNEAAPRVMKALADSMGVPIGQLRDMAKEGQLTADVVGNALIDSLEQLREEAKQTQTIAGAFTTIKNRLFLLVGEMGNALNASQGMAESIQWLGDAVNFVAKGALRFLSITVVSVVGGFKKMGIAIRGVIGFLEHLWEADSQGARDAFVKMNEEAARLDIETKKTINNILNAGSGVDNNTESVKRLHAAQTQVSEETKKQAEAQLKAAKAAKERYENEIKSISERADKLAFEEATYGMLPSAITEVTIARKKDEKAALSAHGKSTKLIEQEIEALERLRDVQAGQEYRKQQRKNAEQKRRDDEEAARRAKRLMDKQQQDWEKANEANLRASQNMLDSYSRSITDAIFRGFESGKGIIQNFKDTLINTFKTMILRPRIEAVVAGVLGGGSGSATAGGFNLGNLFGGSGTGGGSGIDLSSIGSIYKGITQGFDSLNLGFSQSISDLGGFLVDQGFDKLGSSIFTNSTQISQALGAAGSIYSAYNFLKEGNTAGAIATGIGFAIGGPIGGALGSAVGSLFGGKKQPPRSLGYVRTTIQDGELDSGFVNPGYRRHEVVSSITDALDQPSQFVASIVSSLASTFGGAGNVSLDTRYSGRDGGSSYKSILGSVDGQQFGVALHRGEFGEEDLKNYLTELTGAHLATIIQQLELPERVKTIFSGVANPEIIQSLTGSVKLLNDSQDVLNNKFGLTADNVYQIADQLGVTGSAFVKFASDLSSAAAGVTKVSEQILSIKQAVTDALTFFPSSDSLEAYDAFIKQTADSGNIGAAGLLLGARSGVAQYHSLLSSTRNAANASVFDLRSEGDQTSLRQSEAARLFGQFGLSIPSSADELVAIADSIDYTTEAGLDLAVAMPSLVEAFKALNGEVATSTSTLLSNAAAQQVNADNFATLADYRIAQAKANRIDVANDSTYSKSTSSGATSNPEVEALKKEVESLKNNPSPTDVSIMASLNKMTQVLQKMDELGVVISEKNISGSALTIQTKAA